MKLKVVMVDDHLMIIEGMKKQLSTIPFIELVGFATNPQEALKLIASKTPDIIVFDYELPELNGYELMCEVKKLNPEIKTICYTMHNEPWILQKLIKGGVDGIVLKTDNPEMLNQAIDAVANGRKYIPKNVLSTIIDASSTFFSNDQLTDREIEVLRLIATELSSKEIADRMHLSENTIESYRKNLLIKLNAKNMAGLVLKGMQIGIIH